MIILIILLSFTAGSIITNFYVSNKELKKRIDKFSPDLGNIKILYIEKEYVVARIPNKLVKDYEKRT